MAALEAWTPVRLTEAQVEAAGEMAARAFFDDPGMAYVFRDEKRRMQQLEKLLAAVVRYGHRYGEVYTTPDSLEGVAVWVPPPGRAGIGVVGTFRSGFWEAMRHWNLAELFRYVVLGMKAAVLDFRSYRIAHSYLVILAVDPPSQRRGIGTALLQPALANADAAGIPCALETITERNVTFYRNQGFWVTGSGDCPLGGPKVWTMWREPRADGMQRP